MDSISAVTAAMQGGHVICVRCTHAEQKTSIFQQHDKFVSWHPVFIGSVKNIENQRGKKLKTHLSNIYFCSHIVATPKL